MRAAGLLMWTVIVAVLGLLPAHADKRVALVIGNGAYRHAAELPNPKNDAADIAPALNRLGFAVTPISDATADNMRRALVEFGRAASNADIAVVFFAGHGMEVGGENWLLPVDAQLRADTDAEHEAVSLRSVMNVVASARQLGLVILDSCRNNPLAARMQRRALQRSVDRGLARVDPSGSVLVAYAARDGTTASDGAGRNSPFTAALLKNIETPGLEINFLFRSVRDEVLAATTAAGRPQEPFTYGSLSRQEIYLKAGPPIRPIDIPAQTWAMIKDTTDIRVLEEFAHTHADSPEAAAARRRVVVLRQPPPLPPPCAVRGVAVELARSARPLSAAEECALVPKDTFRECDTCPEMVVVPVGSFTMGSPEGEPGRGKDEGPQHVVTLARSFAVGRFEVTVDQFAAFVRDSGYEAGSACDVIEGGRRVDNKPGRSWRDPGFAQNGKSPVTCLSHNDAKSYVAWLARTTGRPYRLLTEAEWEFAARARTASGIAPRYGFGDDPSAMCRNGNAADETAKRTVFGAIASSKSFFACSDGYAHTAPVGSFLPNAFGLFDMHGNVWEWVEDCYADSYAGASANGAAQTAGDCRYRVLRGGSWVDDPSNLRAAYRFASERGDRVSEYGLRVARSLAQ